VERAQPLQPAAAGALELDPGLDDDLLDGGALADLLDALVPDPPCHLQESR